jgi:hypothetical protein
VAAARRRRRERDTTPRPHAGEGAQWLLLFHQIPPEPATLRVRVWRRLQSIGAVSVKNSLYVLPNHDERHEDLRWIQQEIVQAGGDATICEARLLEGLSDDEVRALFIKARSTDYASLVDEAQPLRRALARPLAVDGAARKELEAQLAKVQRRLREIGEIDFFPSPARADAERLMDDLGAKLAATRSGDTDGATGPHGRPSPRHLRARTWVTRTGIHVDRIASAWLIRRFIDRDATFKWVPPKGYVPERGELRFDMFEAEFTHEGNLCTFEVLVRHCAIDDPPLRAIAEIVHDIDLREDAYARPETAGVRGSITGLCAAHRDDAARLRVGSELFDSLYAFFSLPKS